MQIVRAEPGEARLVLACSALFDNEPTEAWATRFLTSPGHHLLIALGGADRPIGFVSGIEMTHPDKGTEMFLYELAVHPQERQRGVGRSLVTALRDLARDRGCYGMWVATEPDNAAALATYRSAGATAEEACVTLGWTFDRPPED